MEPDFERNTNSWFVKDSGIKKDIMYYYYCNRSGHFMSQSTGQRHVKTHGTSKLSDSDKVAIAGKLSQGVDIQHILDDVRDNIGSKYQRLHLLTRKDIKKIERAYCVTEHQRHQDDATSVCLWVEEMIKQKLNSVLLYKAQDRTPSFHLTLKNNDFAIGIQTPL